MLVTILVTLPLALALVALAKGYSASRSNTAIALTEIARRSNSNNNMRPMSALHLRSVKEEDISLTFLSANPMLQNLQFDEQGNIYLQVRHISPDSAGRPRVTSKLAKLAADGLGKKEYSVTTFPELDVDWHDFAVSKKGAVYAAFASHNSNHGGIALLNEDGTLATTFKTFNFQPIRLSVGADDNLWTVGKDYTNSPSLEPKEAVYEGQVRIYDTTGGLVSTVINGITDEMDIPLARIVSSPSHTWTFIRSTQAVSQFTNGKLGQVARLNQPNKVALGAYTLRDKMVWYGWQQLDLKRPPRGAIIWLTNLSGEVISSDTELPSNLQSLAGADKEGLFYFYGTCEGQPCLQRIKLQIE